MPGFGDSLQYFAYISDNDDSVIKRIVVCGSYAEYLRIELLTDMLSGQVVLIRSDTRRFQQVMCNETMSHTLVQNIHFPNIFSTVHNNTKSHILFYFGNLL